jgi:demethylmenaquinone methyltransferase / 2-methoxy-6-polyprenyl-1,4-benzoquinol methylase
VSAARPQAGAGARLPATVTQPGRDPARIETLFDRIVPRYDLMNRLMTGGLDRRWREAAAIEAAPSPAGPLLDICCGTGDLTLCLQRRYPASRVTGLDFSAAMLARAREKAVASGAGQIEFVRGDVMSLPFEDDSFSAATVGWGLRNVADLGRALSELRRVVRPRGRVVALEATRPPGTPGRCFHALWLRRVVPLLGRCVAGEHEAYSYLPESVRSFPSAEGLAEIMAAAGLERVRFRRFGLGAMALHVGTVPL